MKKNLKQAIEDGSIWESSSNELQDWLLEICSGNIPNTTVHPREIVKGITINHAQMSKTIKKLEETIIELNEKNEKTQNLVIILASVTLIVGIIQIIVAIVK